ATGPSCGRDWTVVADRSWAPARLWSPDRSWTPAHPRSPRLVAIEPSVVTRPLVDSGPPAPVDPPAGRSASRPRNRFARPEVAQPTAARAAPRSTPPGQDRRSGR